MVMEIGSNKIYLRLANMGFSEIRRLISNGEFQEAHELADSLHNLGDWQLTKISLEKHVEEFPSEFNKNILNVFRELPERPIPKNICPEWKARAYPLRQVFLHLQGTRFINSEGFSYLLEEVKQRIHAGHQSGCVHDDDFGYSFEVTYSDDSFFDEPFGSR